MKIRKGFTIWELIVVVIVVVILAAIATPNFLEAQTRSPRRPMQPPIGFNTESYSHNPDNPFLLATVNPLSTFSIDVDTASYSNMRRFIGEGRLPPADAVRIEELINYFAYQYPEPKEGEPFSVLADTGDCPWNSAHRLARIALKARAIDWGQRPPCNIVFLLDTSGSMDMQQKLPLVKLSMKLLVENLSANDSVAIVTYAGSSGVILPSTSCADPTPILDALDSLNAIGSTNGAGGIEAAYDVASRHFIKGGVNRVILATDGDFNVGITDEGSLVRLIEDKAKTGIMLSVLGYGMGNIKDSNLEKLADHGNGNYAYIDSIYEARKALVEQVSGTFMTVAKDVKIQVEFNPARVSTYRLVGYEDRMLKAEDFKDDAKDAGDMGPGHCVTAFYEIVPVGSAEKTPDVDPLKYSDTRVAASPELMTVKIRYKQPDSGSSRQMDFPVVDQLFTLPITAPDDFTFAAAVAEWGMVLRNSKDRGGSTPDSVEAMALKTIGPDKAGYRHEFIDIVRKGRKLLNQAGAEAQHVGS